MKHTGVISRGTTNNKCFLKVVFLGKRWKMRKEDGELKSVAPKYIEVLTPGTCAHNLTWKQSLKMPLTSGEVIQMALNQYGTLYVMRHRDREGTKTMRQ